MVRCKDAAGWVLLAGVVALGCSSAPSGASRLANEAAARPSTAKPVARIEPDPRLRISEPPATEQDPMGGVLVASAAPPTATPETAPSKRDASPRESNGPSLTDLSPADQLKELRRLYKEATEQYAKMDSYIARLRRREQVADKVNPEEVIRFQFRREPWSVSLKWLGSEGKGREVIYVKGKFEDKIHTLLATGDMPLMPAGKRISLPVDSLLVKSASRHPITQAGIGALVDNFGTAVDAAARGDAKRGSLTYLGPQARPEFTKAHELAEQIIPPKSEPTLPRGGRRLWFFDPDSHLPVLIITYDDAKKEVEYYLYDRLHFPVKLDDDDFNPEKMGAKP